MFRLTMAACLVALPLHAAEPATTAASWARSSNVNHNTNENENRNSVNTSIEVSAPAPAPAPAPICADPGDAACAVVREAWALPDDLARIHLETIPGVRLSLQAAMGCAEFRRIRTRRGGETRITTVCAH